MPFWQNPCVKQQREDERNPWIGEKNNKQPLKPYKVLAIGLPDLRKAFILCDWTERDIICRVYSWNLCAPYRHQNWGNVERMNRTLKALLRELCQEKRRPWVQVLPIMLLGIQCTPHKATCLMRSYLPVPNHFWEDCHIQLERWVHLSNSTITNGARKASQKIVAWIL